MPYMKFFRFCAALVFLAAAFSGSRVSAQPTAPAPSATAPAASNAAAVGAPALPRAAAMAGKPGMASAGPKIAFDNMSFNFGKILVGEKVRHTYIMTNTGNSTLIITNVHPGCHCTALGDWSHAVEPGQTGGISIQFDSTGFNGPITRHVDVYCNAVDGPPMRMLTLTGTITKAIDISPSNPLLSIAADATNSVSTTVRLVNQMEKPVSLGKITSVNSNFVVRLKELRAGMEWELAITVNPPFPQNTTSGLIKIDTSNPVIGSVTLNALARVEPTLQVQPPQIFFNGSPDTWTTNKINIRGMGKRLLELTNLMATDPRLVLDLKPGSMPGAFILEVAFPPGFQTEPGKRPEITANSNDPHTPTIHVPVMVYPARARPGGTYMAHPPVATTNVQARLNQPKTAPAPAQAQAQP